MEETLIEKRQRLEREVAEFKEKLRLASNALIYLDDSCQHEWGETENADVYHKGYRCPGDTPGTMGVDFRGPSYVSAKTDKRWKHICKKCGKVDYTTRTNTVETKTPKW